MSLVLLFDPAKFPRTITRKEWKEIWRWKRMATKELKKELEKRMHNALLYGSSHPELWDSIINPPLLIHDKQEFP
jgi:hypothetical protein